MFLPFSEMTRQPLIDPDVPRSNVAVVFRNRLVRTTPQLVSQDPTGNWNNEEAENTVASWGNMG